MSQQRCQRLRPLILVACSVETCAFAAAYVQVYVAAAFFPLNKLTVCKTLEATRKAGEWKLLFCLDYDTWSHPTHPTTLGL